jgi:biotin carboxyl carrier protein
VITDDMAELVKLFEGSDLRELTIEQHGRKLFLRKADGAIAQPAPEEEVESPSQDVAVRAHMVGTFFWNREKSGKPAVGLRQAVEKGQIVGYIEALGIFNEVEAPEAGEVVEIAIAGGQPVEYGQPLVILKAG